MSDSRDTITDINGQQVVVIVRRDKRLKKNSHWRWQKDGTILLRVPYRLPKHVIGQHLDQIATQLQKQEKLAERRTDAGLQGRAEYINKKHFGGKIEWCAIRWVGNMNHRLGSCTTGGLTDGQIRISEKIRNWPQWVIDYVIAHELVHRLYANHSSEFWDTLITGYPLAEKARGFIEGAGFSEGITYEQN
jgi:predicted metal-dependent hydrolase